jgi:Golgi nucleoside diphosphatase
MFESTLATTQDADLILKLYQLRTEPTMRQARNWLIAEFFPTRAEETTNILCAMGTQENAWLRQVISYWDMAAAFVTHGALNAELFLDCNTEPFFLFAKFEPFLKEIRAVRPTFLTKMQRLVDEYPEARARVNQMVRSMPDRAAAAARARNGAKA